MKKNPLIQLILLVVTVLGIVLFLVSAVADAIGIGGSQGFGRNQIIGTVVGVIVAVSGYCGYWFHRWLKDELTLEDAPHVLLMTLVLFGLPIILIVIANLFSTLESEFRALKDVDNRLNTVQANVDRRWRQLMGCTPSSINSTPAVKLEPVVSGLFKPVYVAHAKDGSDRLFVVEKSGVIRIVKDGVLIPEPFLDIRARVISEESTPPGGVEQGLLSVAFHPEYVANGRFFINYTVLKDQSTIVAEYHVTANSNLADGNGERVILQITQPHHRHNGGQLQFGPDGLLYIGTGDGGGSSSGGGRNNSQNLRTLHGKILRIDINSDRPYTIPPDNPFVDQPGVRPEIYAYGFRNPWRFSFDRCDGSLFLGDVGQSTWEEIDLVIESGNYGWKTMEGTHCYFPSQSCVRTGLRLPISEYRHLRLDKKGGNAVIGGYVYRGRRFPGLTGRYFFGDLVSTRLWSLTQTRSGSNHWERQELLEMGFQVSSFGEGEDGELYVLDYSNGMLYLLTQASAS